MGPEDSLPHDRSISFKNWPLDMQPCDICMNITPSNICMNTCPKFKRAKSHKIDNEQYLFLGDLFSQNFRTNSESDILV